MAEGVENEATGDLLAHMDCDIPQGYLIGHPLPAAEMERWLRERTHAAA